MDEVMQIAAIIAATVAPSPDTTSALPIDPPAATAAWPGEDKFRHVAMSWATMAFTYAGARSADIDDDTALLIGAAVTVAAGIGKEIVDVRRGGPFSAGDLIADAAGLTAGWLLLRRVR